MESDGFVDPDEVVADSEDELAGSFQSAGNDFGGAGILDDTSLVSAFTMTNRPQTKQVSSISAFTNTAVQSQKDQDEDTSIDFVLPGYTSFGAGLDDFSGVSSIADRAKTRQRNTKTSTQIQSNDFDVFELQPPRKKGARLSSQVIELSSEEDEFNIRPSTSTAKVKSKPKPKAKDKEKTVPQVQPDPSDPSHSPKEPPLTVKPKRRPKPRPLYKVAQAGSAASMPPPANYHQDFDLPIATPSPRPPLVFHDSHLPPSDPPMSSSIPGFDARDDRIPPIVTLRNDDSDLDGPLSSPLSSLFGDTADSRKKISKRVEPDIEVDELAPSQGANPYAVGYGNSMYDSPRKGMPPPPTFFAGSSSSSIGRGPGRQPLSPEPGPVEPDIVDLTMLPPTVIPTPQPLKKPATVKKPRKKKDDAVILDEDEKDDDFNPLADEGKSKEKSKKAKTSKAKVKKVKGGESLPVPEHAQVEVVIVTKPKGKTKGKGKDKTKDPAANKEVFKSREFIEDSDGEDDPLQLRAHGPEKEKEPTETDPGPSGSGAGNVGPSSMLSVANKGTRPLSPPSSKSGPARHSDPPAPFEPDPDMPAATKRKRVSKKRKSIVDFDIDEDVVADEEAPESSSKKKRHKGKSKEIEPEIHVNPPSKKPSAQKGKRIILSDEEGGGDTFEAEEWEKEDTSEVIKVKKAKVVAGVGGNKSSKGTKGDQQDKSRKHITRKEDQDGDSFMDDPQDDPPMINFDDDVVETVKENIGPISRSDSSIVKAPSTLNHDREQTKKDTFPALYSRYEIAPRRSSLPMSELIRRASSTPGTPSAAPNTRPRVSLPSASTSGPRIYSPYLKSSRSMLSRIAPLHPNRRTPPPPPPPPPPKKKTKKEIEREEKWEEELIDSVGGINDWACLPDEEKKELRRIKWAKEMGDWDD